MSTLNSNRIPLHVNHDGSNTSNYTTYRTSTKASSSGVGGGNGDTNEFQSTAYNMSNMNDETDRIKNRMKEFEDRCKKWRQDFFTRSQSVNTSSVFDQRIPFHESTNEQPCSQHHSPLRTNHPPSSFTSTMHKSYLEDLQDGSAGKIYKVEFEIGDFNQNELLITTNNRTLCVKGDRELKAGSATETKTFNREITLPEYVDLNKMNAYLMENAIPSIKGSQTHLIGLASNNNVLIIEAPVIMEKYQYRRSAYNNQSGAATATTNGSGSSNNIRSQSPQQQQQHISRHCSPTRQSSHTTSLSPSKKTISETYHSENKSSTSSSSTTHTSKVLNQNNSTIPEIKSTPTRSYSQTNLLSSQVSLAPELIPGYPAYDNVESCVVYKFDLTGFDQSEIHLTITVDRTLEIKACKESQDHLGKIYREFKREIQLEAEVDANLIKNLLHEGILTVKIPKPNKPDGLGSVSNAHNLSSPNGPGFREFYNDTGKLAKLTSDFRGYNPENVKIVLSANNILKVTAQQLEAGQNSKLPGTVQKECTRQYTLPSCIQPEQMKAIMSRDGILTVDFTNGNSIIKSNFDTERIHIN